jgi:hypothetical protein
VPMKIHPKFQHQLTCLLLFVRESTLRDDPEVPECVAHGLLCISDSYRLHDIRLMR